ncbi:GPI mannosyltransferase 1-like [Ruditapes philippinarum]|uniref:GPI mannosyltransferase 1-like n=1 Tax=Ruditapes philippinarum TaxID=129788 RepID=UPI00295BFE4F|nr:GPI mannosyltransferase 1-like [Ruditapes philippinarum]
MNMVVLVLVGLFIRLCLIIYGEWQDRTMTVKFTDIDYFVFNDAASYITQGKSPYLRATYRYTPLLAWMLQPNIWYSSVFGKLLFIILDVYTGHLIYSIVISSKNITPKTAKLCAAFWLFNPLSMTVSSRGNAESIMTCLVLLCLKLLLERKVLSSAIVYSLAVHFKIYPVTYAIPIYLFLNDSMVEKGKHSLWKTSYSMIKPTQQRVGFVMAAGITLAMLTGVFYYMYGWEFLHHTYLYHVTRKDIRHNFSVYFYMLYQQSGADKSVVISLVSFIPQVLLLLVFSVKFYATPELVFFLNTFAFVTFNKVCTSQYFLWYLCLLPLLFPYLTKISLRKAAVLVILWFTGQGIWLLPAYYLEFQGYNTFLYIWLAGLVFFVINCYIIYEIMDNYSSKPYVFRKSALSVGNGHTVDKKSKGKKTSDEVYKSTSNENFARNTRSQTKRRVKN